MKANISGALLTGIIFVHHICPVITVRFDFRYNARASVGYDDMRRTVEAVRSGECKRLTYHQPREAGL